MYVQTSNKGDGGRASGGVAINKPNQPRVPSTNREPYQQPASTHPHRSSAATTNPARSSAPYNNPANSSAVTTYPPRSSAPPNTSTSNPSKNINDCYKKWRKGSITSDTLNASRNAPRYRELLRANESQASVHGPRGLASGI